MYYNDFFSWGCDHESQAKIDYELTMLDHHTNFSITASGLFVNPQYPHLGASPDGIITCSCCGI